MTRAKTAAYWITPSLLCTALYWYGLKAWFQGDDFAWLSLWPGVHKSGDFLHALFAPAAQGTLRPWSERAYFMALYSVFGLDSLPFRAIAFLTQFANLVLVAAIARRLTGSPAAGFWTAVFWIVNTSASMVLAWASVYNQALCGLFLLLAFYFFLLYVDTGRRRYYWLQVAVFVLGFGALEINIVYPALAASYTGLCARKYLRRVLPLFAVSVVYAVAHRIYAPPDTSGAYGLHFTGSMLHTLATYWAWTIGPSWLRSHIGLPHAVLVTGVAAVTVALLGFAFRAALRRERLPLFFLAWFLIALAPVLPFRDHLTEYYPYLPAIGVAMLGGWAVATAWRRGAGWRAAAVAVSAIYLLLVVPESWLATRFWWARSMAVKNVVLGVQTAHELHPGKAILLEGVDDALFWHGILNEPFPLVGIREVYLAPGTEKRISPHPEWGEVGPFVLPEQAAQRALRDDAVAVYDVTGPRLKNITSSYAAREAAKPESPAPRRLDAGNPLMAYLLESGWYEIDSNHRWMGRKATVRMGGPASASEQLHLSGTCAGGPANVTVSVDGAALPPAHIGSGESAFDLAFAFPREAAGKPQIQLTVETDRTVRAPGDNRELGLAFGVFEIR